MATCGSCGASLTARDESNGRCPRCARPLSASTPNQVVLPDDLTVLTARTVEFDESDAGALSSTRDTAEFEALQPAAEGADDSPSIKETLPSTEGHPDLAWNFVPPEDASKTVTYDDKRGAPQGEESSDELKTAELLGDVPGVFATTQTVDLDDNALTGNDSGRTISMDDDSSESNLSASQTMSLDDGPSHVTPNQTFMMDDEAAAEAGRTINIEEGDADSAAGRTMMVEDEAEAFADPDKTSMSVPPAPGEGPRANQTVVINEEGSVDEISADSAARATVVYDEDVGDGSPTGTIVLPDAVDTPSDNVRATMEMSDQSDSGSSATMADISKSALFGEDEAGGSSWAAPDSGSGSGGSGSSEPSSRETFISDDVKPGSSETAQTGEVLPPAKVDEVMRTVWHQAEKNARPGMTIRGVEVIKAPPTKTPLCIKVRTMTQPGEKPSTETDYELIRVLGEGGMGIVYDGRQTSIDRNVALKMLKPNTASDEKQRLKFLAEAVVTGDLDHPNIVPIYDVGTNLAGALFYSMKKVSGTPWDKKITKATLGENIEILMKVADAVAFAHARGIVHRDLKPENIMLGEFGEVLVMDWGLAQATPKFRKRSSISESHSMGGTPAYMAPEMATGPLDKIGHLSDVYLLGAILFEAITGKPPHTGKNAMMCLMSAARNEIISSDKSGELMEIARKAMSTKPAERHQSVQDFQQAIREYLSHTESIALSSRAVEDLDAAAKSDNYDDFARARFGFEEAIALWSGNQPAHASLAEVRVAYASSAIRKGDYDLGASLLDPAEPSHGELFAKIRKAKDDAEARARRLKLLRNLVVVLVGVGLVGATGFSIAVESQRRRALAGEATAIKEKKEADIARALAVTNEQKAIKEEENATRSALEARNSAIEAAKQEKLARSAEKVANDNLIAAKISEEKAVAARKEAEEQKEVAVAAKKTAEEQTKLAVAAKEAQEYEAYVARIGLASARIKENAFDTAYKLLLECMPEDATQKDYRNWEWGRLMHLCKGQEDSFPVGSVVESISLFPDGTRIVTGSDNHKATIWNLADKKALFELPHQSSYVRAVVVSPDGKTVATGSDRKGELFLWDAATGQKIKTFEGHDDGVTSIAFSGDGKRLLTGSYDNSARLWNIETGKEIRKFQGHSWWVWSVAFSPDEKRIVTASQDGTARVWDVASPLKLPPFTGHSGPVYAAVFSPDGREVVSGGYDKKVLIWSPDDVQPYDYKKLIKGEKIDPPKFRSLEGHTAAVRSVSFSPDAKGSLILTSSDDNTIKVWDSRTLTALKTLRGHDKKVLALQMSADGTKIFSGSQDRTVAQWSLTDYEEFRVLRGRVLEGHTEDILAATFSDDGKEVVTASKDRTARTWDLATGKTIRTLQEGHSFLASAGVFYPDGKRLITSAIDNTVRIWSVTTGTELRRLERTGRSATVALSNDGQWIVTGSDKSGDTEVWKVRVWSAEGGAPDLIDGQSSEETPVRELLGHRAEVTALAFSPDDRLLVSGDAKGECIAWDIRDGRELYRIQAHQQKISAIRFLSDGRRILIASTDKTVGQYDPATGSEMRGLNLIHGDAVLSLAVAVNSPWVITSTADGKVTQWDADQAKVVRELAQFEKKKPDTSGDALSENGKDSLKQAVAEYVDISPDGSRALAAVPDERGVYVWDLKSGAPVVARNNTKGLFLELNQNEGMLWSAIFAPDINMGDLSAYILTIGGSDGRLWTTRGSQLMDFTPHSAVASAGFSPDGKYVVTGSWDNSARIWSTETGRAVIKLEAHPAKGAPGNQGGMANGHTGFVNTVVFSPDGKSVLTASDDKTAILWDVKTGQVTQVYRGHKGGVTDAIFSSDGKHILTSSRDRTARIWSRDSAEVLAELVGHDQSVTCVAVSEDGKWAVTGSEDSKAIVWNLETKKQTEELEGHTDRIASVSFAPDSLRVITGSQDGTAKLWDVITGKEILTLDGHSQEVTSVSFSKQGDYVLTSSRDGTAIVWLTLPWKDEKADKANVAVKDK